MKAILKRGGLFVEVIKVKMNGNYPFLPFSLGEGLG